MKTYVITVDDKDQEYVEQILNAIPNGCREPATVVETKPIPKTRKKRPASDG